MSVSSSLSFFTPFPSPTSLALQLSLSSFHVIQLVYANIVILSLLAPASLALLFSLLSAPLCISALRRRILELRHVLSFRRGSRPSSGACRVVATASMAGDLSDPVTSLFLFGCEYGPLPSWIWTPFQTPSLRGDMDLFQVVDRGHAHDAERVMPVLSSKF